jgi:hypothetical protein
LAQALAEVVRTPRSWLGLGEVPLTPLTLVVVPDVTAFAEWSRGRIPGWGAGLTIASRRLVVIRADAGTPRATLIHEMAHLAFNTVVHTRVPLWFSEGYAALAAGEHGRLDALQLNLSVALGNVPGLGELNAALRGSAGEAGAGYALAASAVADIARRHPDGTLNAIIGRLRDGMPFDEALLRSTGLDHLSFAEEWHKAIRRRYNFGVWLIAGGAWAIVALVLGFLLASRRRRDAPRRAALDENWPLPPTDDELISGDDGSMTVTDPGPICLDRSDPNP